METWVSFITEVGFPIAVTFYLLHRIEGKLNLLIESIHSLPAKMKEQQQAPSLVKKSE
ncbi:YvrJ family protein [Oceanobacillus chungangensis]|uniref:YvrJ family protein n=1 Tax=Oceanobacillus chungangensis TaxID=1229152 RepID=A0A3D8PK25_9BACI|nr:YvrJ family protein [Oceanobacillus chungangensis]RDW15545.1 YvrJ family protein [Oceanobacillus chungangensis]